MLQFGDYSHYGSYVCIEQLPATFYDALAKLTGTDCTIGFSKINNHGFVLKILAYQTQVIEAVLIEVDKKVRAIKEIEPLLLRKY